MALLNLLYKRSYPINDKIEIVIPSVGEVIDNEESYYGAVSAVTSMPIDLMAPLDDIGIDFTKISDYELFLILFRGLQENDTSLLFGDLDLTKFEYVEDAETGAVTLLDRANDIVIDKRTYQKIATVLRHIHHLKKDTRTPGNEAAKEYMIRRAKEKLKRNKGNTEQSQLEPMILALVNTEQFKYDFEGTRELSIYQFNESVRQIMKKIDYDNVMFGIYTGNINAKELSQSDLTWLTNK